MIIDLVASNDLPTSTDVLVVGAGPMGQATAKALIDAGSRVMLVESGGPTPQSSRTDLDAGEIVGEPRLDDLRWIRSRAVGGTSWRWANDLDQRRLGVRYAVMEPTVLARRRPGIPSWPLSLDDLRPWYDEALSFAGTNALFDDLLPVPAEGLSGLDESAFTFGPRSQYRLPTIKRWFDRPGAVLVMGATVVGLLPAQDDSTRVGVVRIRGDRGGERSVAVASVVLAANTIENVRQVLLASKVFPGLSANSAVGLGYMDRPRLTGTLELAGPTPELLRRFDMRRRGHALLLDRLMIPQADVDEGTPSCAFIVGPRPSATSPRRRIERLSRLALIEAERSAEHKLGDYLGRRIGPALVFGIDRSYPVRARLFQAVQRASWDLEWTGWAKRDAAFASRDWSVTAIVEQPADPTNRIELTASLDRYGVALPRVVFGRPIEVDESLERAFDTATKAFADAGIGTLTFGDTFDSVTSHHLMGGLAMGTDPLTSATDIDARVRGVANLYAAGSCLFPTSGSSNPLLTSLALSRRLGSYLSGSGR